MKKKNKGFSIAGKNRKSKKRESHSCITDLLIKYDLFDLKVPSRLRNDYQMHLQKLSDFWHQTAIELTPYTVGEILGKGSLEKEIRFRLVAKMQNKFDEYLSSYSPSEQRFLLSTFLKREWLEIAELFIQDDSIKVVKSLFSERQKFIIAWSNYQVFKKYLSGLEDVFTRLWKTLDPILFSEFDRRVKNGKLNSEQQQFFKNSSPIIVSDI